VVAQVLRSASAAEEQTKILGRIHIPKGDGSLNVIGRLLACDVPRHAIVRRNLVHHPMIGACLGSAADHLELVFRQPQDRIKTIQPLGSVADVHKLFWHELSPCGPSNLSLSSHPITRIVLPWISLWPVFGSGRGSG